LRGLLGAADLLLHEVAVDTGRLATFERDRKSRRKLMADQQLKVQNLSESRQKTGTDRAQAQRTATEIRNARARTDHLLTEQEQARIATRDVLDQMVAAQEQFLRVVAAARGMIEKPGDPDGGTGARRPNSAPGASRGSAQDPSTQPFSRRLDELQRVIRSEKVALDVDKGVIWVDATIDGSHRLRMIVEPKAEGLRVSAHTATEAGVRPMDGEPAVEVETSDGRVLRARSARLDSVQVGPYIVHDVECLVLPAAFGDSPPSLGADLLGRFSTRIDATVGTMTLTQLNIKPIFRAAEPRR
jgi:hypothetical protein